MSSHNGLLWGAMGAAADPIFVPRRRDDRAVADGGDWFPWCEFAGVEHGEQRFEGDPALRWVGVPVALTTAPASHYLSLRNDLGAADSVLAARAAWELFRDRCMSTVGFDPGEGDLLVVWEGS